MYNGYQMYNKVNIMSVTSLFDMTNSYVWLPPFDNIRGKLSIF